MTVHEETKLRDVKGVKLATDLIDVPVPWAILRAAAASKIS
jgi:hypothetical protein